MGRLFHARDIRLGRAVALKVLARALAGDRVALVRLRREAETASALNHPALVTIYDIGDTPDGQIFIAMELIDGVTLREWAATRRTSAEIMEVIAQVADGLATAHDSGVVHRDIKPDNIMVSRRGFAKVVDFGLAKSALGETSSPENATDVKTKEGMVVGTVLYMAPEQLRGEPLHGACDVFALASVLQQVLTGTAPFEATSSAETIARILEGKPKALPSDIDPAVTELVTRMMRPSPSERPSMREVATRLRDLSRPGLTSTAVLSVPSGARLSRRRWIISSSVVALLVVAGVVGVRMLREPAAPSGSERTVRPSDPAVAELYSRALVFVGTPQWKQQDKGIPLLEEVVKRDPSFLPARTALAFQYSRRAFDRDPDRSWEQKAFLEADHIQQRDPGSGVPHLIRAGLLWTKAHGFPHERALAEAARSIELDPLSTRALTQRGHILLHMGLIDEALRDYQQVLAIRPADFEVTMRVARAHLWQGDAATALREFQQYAPDNHQVAIALITLGRDSDATQFLGRVDGETEDMKAVSALLAARAGDRDAARRLIQEAIALGSDSSHFHHAMYTIACVYAAMGEAENAVFWLERVSNEGMPAYPLFARDPLLDPIRRQPRFSRFLNDSREALEARRRAVAQLLPRQ